ncbi:unnamed protein product [Schistocephalus solidus]|uniref:Secreted protein n=1 Tax=Schistocephalus solidus TaxID=70667 RepID=A0A183TKB1_SCHSO|nr:unnamed protein product [Schistocephalus solidus]
MPCREVTPQMFGNLTSLSCLLISSFDHVTASVDDLTTPMMPTSVFDARSSGPLRLEEGEDSGRHVNSPARPLLGLPPANVLTYAVLSALTRRSVISKGRRASITPPFKSAAYSVLLVLTKQ